MQKKKPNGHVIASKGKSTDIISSQSHQELTLYLLYRMFYKSDWVKVNKSHLSACLTWTSAMII